MIKVELIRGNDSYKKGEAIWCIAGQNFNGYDKFNISYEKIDLYLTPEQMQEHFDNMTNWGLIHEIIKGENKDTFIIDLKYYTTYTKVVTILTIFRSVFNKYSSSQILSNYFLLKPVFPELDTLQLYIFAFYRSVHDTIDTLHSITKCFMKPVTIEVFKSRFEEKTLNAMFLDKEILIKPLLHDYKKNKEKILNLVL